MSIELNQSIPCSIHLLIRDHYSMCLLGVRPDYKIEVREDILAEDDGPMLVHGSGTADSLISADCAEAVDKLVVA